jgi:hypothetical protein
MRSVLPFAVVCIVLGLGVMPAEAQGPFAPKEKSVPAQSTPAAPDQKEAATPQRDAAQASAEDAFMDDHMRRARAAYDDAVKNLTDEQREELKRLDAEFSATMDADMRILHRSAEIEYCLSHDGFFKADRGRHVQGFVEWRDKLREGQKAAQAEHMKKRYKVGFVPAHVLNNYYLYQQKMLSRVGLALVRQQMQQGLYAGTDCELLASKLLLRQ